MSKTIIEKIIKSEQEEMTLADIYVDNVNLLFEKCVRIFKWNETPKNLPQREIEKYIIALGFCGFVNDKNVVTWFLMAECLVRHSTMMYLKNSLIPDQPQMVERLQLARIA